MNEYPFPRTAFVPLTRLAPKNGRRGPKFWNGQSFERRPVCRNAYPPTGSPTANYFKPAPKRSGHRKTPLSSLPKQNPVPLRHHRPPDISLKSICRFGRFYQSRWEPATPRSKDQRNPLRMPSPRRSRGEHAPGPRREPGFLGVPASGPGAPVRSGKAPGCPGNPPVPPFSWARVPGKQPAATKASTPGHPP